MAQDIAHIYIGILADPGPVPRAIRKGFDHIHRNMLVTAQPRIVPAQTPVRNVGRGHGHVNTQLVPVPRQIRMGHNVFHCIGILIIRDMEPVPGEIGLGQNVAESETGILGHVFCVPG